MPKSLWDNLEAVIQTGRAAVMVEGGGSLEVGGRTLKGGRRIKGFFLHVAGEKNKKKVE